MRKCDEHKVSSLSRLPPPSFPEQETLQTQTVAKINLSVMIKLLILSEIMLIYSIFEFICSASAVVIFADIKTQPLWPSNVTWRHWILQESPGLQ